MWKAIRLYESLGRDDKLEETFPLFLKEHPFSPYHLEAWIKFLMLQHRHPERYETMKMKKQAEEILAQYPTFQQRTNLLLFMCELCEKEGKFDEAIRWTDRIIQDSSSLNICLPALGRKMSLARLSGDTSLGSSATLIFDRATQSVTHGIKSMILK